MKRYVSWGLAVILGLSLAWAGCASDKASKDEDEKSDSDSDKKKGKDKDKGDKKSGEATSAPPTGGSAQPAAPATATQSPTAAGGAKAYMHMGPDCELAIISDLEKILAHPSFAREVTPKLRDLIQKPSSDAKVAKMQAWAKDVGLTEKSARSMALCAKNLSAPDPAFRFMLGTDIKPGSFTSFVEKMNEGGSKKKELIDVGGVQVAQADKVVFGQLSDGVIAAADTTNTFMTLIPSADNVARFKLDTSKAISMFMSEAVIKKFIKPGSKGNEIFEAMTEVVGHLDLTTSKANFRVVCKNEAEAKKLNDFATKVVTDEDIKKKLAGQPMGAAEIVKSMTSRVEGKDVIVELTIPSSSIDEVAKVVAKELEKAIRDDM